MSPLRIAMQRWLDDRPLPPDVDIAGASQRGSMIFRRWLLRRTLLATLAAALVVAGMVGVRAVFAESVIIGAHATAALVVTPTSGLAPLRVVLDGSGSAGAGGAAVTTYDFAFGDGGGTGPQPAGVVRHRYPTAGSYVATLTVTGSDGRSASTSQTVTVQEPQPSDPTAKLRLAPQTGVAPLHVTARGSTSKAGQGAKITSYAFDFDDGQQVPGDPGPRSRAEHTYTLPGTYTVTLRVVNDQGRTDDATLDVTVRKPIPSSPTARLRVEPRRGVVPLEVTARATGSKAGAGAHLTGYAFSWGDGSPVERRSAPTAPHTYAATGTYAVKVTVTNSNGLTDDATQTVSVTPPVPTVQLEVTPTTGEAPMKVSASGRGSTAGKGALIESYTFDFGDGQATGPQTGPTSAHGYDVPGIYRVTLTVKNTAGQTSTAVQRVEVLGPRPTAVLSLDPASGVKPLAVTAVGRGSEAGRGAKITTYTFDFGDGSDPVSSARIQASHSYAKADSYVVTLTVTNSWGRKHSTTRDVTVLEQNDEQAPR